MQSFLLSFGRVPQIAQHLLSQCFATSGRVFRFNLSLRGVAKHLAKQSILHVLVSCKNGIFSLASYLSSRAQSRDKNKKRIFTATCPPGRIPHATILTLTTFFFIITFVFSQEKPLDSIKVNQLDEVTINAIRATSKTPISFSNLTKKELKSRNLGQDIPILLNFLPSVVTTSDAGNGVGYTGIRVRGSDATRVNVTINGIPYNDAEGQGTYWVNMPDFASSVESVQLQRGVGTSTNGASAFGASLNLQTDKPQSESSAEIANSIGSFNTRKHTVKYSTGLLNNTFEVSGRLSKIASDGYIDRATSDLKSYFLQGVFINKNTQIKTLVFGGTEKTYQSWNGIDAETMSKNRTFNSAGQYKDEFGNIRFYENEVDNYQQDHAQLHLTQKWNNSWNSNVAFHYTKGKGFFENFKEDANMLDYNITPIAVGGIDINTTDLVRQKWLDNDFYGATFSTNYKMQKIDIVLGGAYNIYEGNHFGKVIWARTASTTELGDKFYDDDARKTDGNVFVKGIYQTTEKLSLFFDVQYRTVGYRANGISTGLVNDQFHFFNPKAGLNYDLNKQNNIYFSYAKANREPNRTDYESGNTKREQLHNLELGFRHQSQKVKGNANFFYMSYKDQLILTGALDDVGNPIRSNTDNSFRFGLEIDASISLSKTISIKPNIAISANKIIDLTVGNTNFGNKNIAYSPAIVGGNALAYHPNEKFTIALLSKFVGEQFMNNIESPEAKLNAYFVQDLNVSYEIRPKKIFKSIVFNGLINNVLNKSYVSNGYMYDLTPYYYPQAGINFLVGVNFGF